MNRYSAPTLLGGGDGKISILLGIEQPTIDGWGRILSVLCVVELFGRLNRFSILPYISICGAISFEPSDGLSRLLARIDHLEHVYM